MITAAEDEYSKAVRQKCWEGLTNYYNHLLRAVQFANASKSQEATPVATYGS